MAEIIEQKIVYSADFTNLANPLQEVLQKLASLRAQLKGLSEDTEEYALVTKQLAQAEDELANIVALGGGKIDSAKVSYNELNNELKALRKEYKTTSDVAQRTKLTPSITAIHQELTTLDRSMGIYNRNVGNYAVEMEKAMANVSLQTTQVIRELPSLANSIQTFFIAISNNLPMLVDAIDRVKQLAKEQKSAANIINASTGAHNAEAEATMAAAAAKRGEVAANAEGMAGHNAEMQATLEEIQSTLDGITVKKAKIAVQKQELQLSLENKEILYDEIVARKTLNLTEEEQFTLEAELHSLELDMAGIKAKIASLTTEEKAAQDSYNASLAAYTKVQATANGEQTKSVSTLGLLAKNLLSWQTLLIVGITLLAMYSKEITNFISKLFKAKEGFEGWSEALKKGREDSAKSVIELQLYSRWAVMAAKSDEERTKAAKQVLKILGEEVNELNIAKVKNGEYAQSIDDITEALIRQAQAQAILETIVQRYKDTVIKAQGKLIDAEERGKPNVLQEIGGALSPIQNADDLYQNQLDRLEEKVKEATEDFQRYVAKLLEDFNPSDLLGGNDGDNGSGDADKWFSKWELYIKTIESGMAKLQGEYESLDLSSIWKYSSEGYDAYMNMFDEIAEHYKNDEKQYKDTLNNKLKYQTEYNEYHQKLNLQYRDSQKTEYEIDKQRLEEWYHTQMAIYENAGEDTTSLTAEYNKRKIALERKYRDEYKNASLQGVEYELAELKKQFDDILYEYEQKGIDTTNVIIEYEQRQKEIISKFESEKTKDIVANLELQKRATLEAFEDIKKIWEDGVKYSYDINVNPRQNLDNIVNQGNDKTEMVYSKLGGTSVTGHQRRKSEYTATQYQKVVFESNMEEQIAAMQSVLESEKLIGSEKLEMEMALAEAERQLALGSAEYQMELNHLVLEDTKETVKERMDEMESIASGIGAIFDDVYSAIETNLEAQIKSGEITEEQAEKELEKYRGIKAAAAAMDAMAAAVSSYNSLASIPYVGPALGAIAAAAALAAGFAQVKSIMTVSKDNPTASQVDSFTPGLSDFSPNYQANITGASEQTDLKNAVKEGMKETNIIVQVKDIEDAQTKVRVRDLESTF